MTPDSTETSDPGWAKIKEQIHAVDEVRNALQIWMRRQLDDPRLTISPLSGPGGTGIANETLLFQANRSNGSVEGYVARLATPDPLYLDYDLRTHYRMYAAMMDIPSVPTPSVLAFEADESVLGAAFFVMERIDGVIPTDNPSWGTQGFVADATAAERRRLWENTVGVIAELHRLDASRFEFLGRGNAGDGVGDCLDYWMRALRWASPRQPIPLVDAAEGWLTAHRPSGTALSWGDSRLPNMIYRDYTPVGVLDWDLVSLAGPEADLAWWITMTADECLALDGIGSHDEFIDLWEDVTGRSARNLHWFLVFSAYRLAAIMAKLLAMFVAQGRMPADFADEQLRTGLHVQMLAGLLDLPPPPGVLPKVPDVRWERG